MKNQTMLHPQRILVLTILCTLLASFGYGWSAAGHQLIALLAWRQLSPAQQAQAAEVLTHLPAFDHDIGPQTAELTGSERNERIFMLASTWPDLVRPNTHPAHGEHRAGWHVVRLPITRPGAAETSAAIAEAFRRPPTGELLEMLTRLRHDFATSTGMTQKDRALALVWIMHLTQDLHQPLHASSLYADGWPDGDINGGNFFVTLHPGAPPVSIHAVWDRLFGRGEPAGKIRAMATSIEQDPSLSRAALAGQAEETSVALWAEESRELSRTAGYGLDTTSPLKGAPGRPMNGIFIPPQTAPPLPDGYEEAACKVSRRRVALAANRLADYLKQTLPE